MTDIVERLRGLRFVHVPVASGLMEEAAAEIERLRNERRWIPLSEREPAMGERVMIGNAPDKWVATGERVLTGAYLHWEDGDGEDLHEPTHWMPLQEPPEVTK